MKDITAIFNHALAALNSRDFGKAEKGFRRVIQLNASHVPALNLLTVVLMATGRFADAEPFIARAVALNQSSDVSFYNYGLISRQLNKGRQAHEQFTRALGLNPNVAETWNSRGAVCSDLREYEQAISDFDQAIGINRNYAEAHANKGRAMFQLNRHDDAFAAYDAALTLKPDLAEAWLGLGNALSAERRDDEAFAAYDKALALKGDLEGAWLGRGNLFVRLKRHEEAFAAFDKALSIKPDMAEPWLGRGNVFTDLRRHDEAFAAYDRALAITEGLEGAWIGRGNSLADLGRPDEALAAYDRALALKPGLAEAWLGRGNVLTDLKQYQAAVAAYDNALAIRADWDGAEGGRIAAKMNICDWENLEEEVGRLMRSASEGRASSSPFTHLFLTSSAEDHLLSAKAWVRANYDLSAAPLRRSNVRNHDKIRVGYISSDFYRHATAYLVAEMFELHDRSRIETIGFSYGPDDGSQMRRRLINSLDEFVDCRTLPDAAIAREIAQSDIDILVDLKGFTQGARPNIFAFRPAPIQVNYLGYPGTMGAPFIDYIIGDQTLFDVSDEATYSEKLVRLAHCYQPNDRTRRIAERKFTREECRLPEQGFVFCCFNNNFKIVPEMFDGWMRILARTQGSVLWLLEDNRLAAENLRKHAAQRGVDASRLIFAKRMEMPDHLARHRLADLFLDTLPYNAHTTASDALWAGLPLLTQIGTTFAGRVAASLLNAIGLPELITHSREEYEKLAVDLACHREKLVRIKQKLDSVRLTAPLFDTALFTRDLEAAYQAMVRRYRAGLQPDHIDVAAIHRSCI
jgi:protein O-GlcNAc transferase